MRYTLSVRLSVCPSVRPSRYCLLFFTVEPSYERTSKIEKLLFSLMGQRHVCTFRHAQRAAYRTAISGVSLKTDRTTAQQTAQLEGDDNVFDRIDDRTDERTATLQKSFRICSCGRTNSCFSTERLCQIYILVVYASVRGRGKVLRYKTYNVFLR